MTDLRSEIEKVLSGPRLRDVNDNWPRYHPALVDDVVAVAHQFGAADSAEQPAAADMPAPRASTGKSRAAAAATKSRGGAK